MLAFEDLPCIQSETEDIYRVYRSDAQVRLGPNDLPCSGYAFVVKRKTGMEIYLALHAREIKRSLIYRVDPEKKNIGDPSSQLKTALDLLKKLDFTLSPVNLKLSPAMLEVVLQDIPVVMAPAKAKKITLDRNATLTVLENQALYLEEKGLLDADEKRLAELSKDDRNRYNTAVDAYKKLALEDRCDEERELLFEQIDALLLGRRPNAPRQPSPPPETVVKQQVKDPPAQPEPAAPSVVEKPAKPAPAVEEPPENKAPAQPPPAPKEATQAFDPRDKQRIRELEGLLATKEQLVSDLLGEKQELEQRLSEKEQHANDLRTALESADEQLETTKKQLSEAEKIVERTRELENQLATSAKNNEDAQKEIQRLKSDHAKALRKVEELEDRLASAATSYDEPVRPRSRLNSGRLLQSSGSSSSSSKPAGDPPHVVRRPPPAGATFGVDWDLERLPCNNLEQVVELYQSICNAQLSLEGYQTQYCAAFIAILKDNGGRQLYMAFNLTQEGRYLVYKPLKKPTSTGELGNLLKEAHKFLKVVGIETEKVPVTPGSSLPSSELQDLFDCA